MGQFPLHQALASKVVESTALAVLRAHPDAAKEKDAYRWLPLHYALASKASVMLVGAALDAYPGALSQSGFLNAIRLAHDVRVWAFLVCARMSHNAEGLLSSSDLVASAS